jgi:RNA polymerase sigma-70 factor (ECF subfamily)
MTQVKVEQIWQNFYKELQFYIYKRVNSPADAEDLMQDIFIKIQKNLPNLKEEAALKSWLYRLTRNTIIDYYRTRKSPQELTDEIAATLPDKPCKNDGDINNLSKCLGGVLSDIPEKYREAIKYTQIEGHSQKELAKKLNISLSGAKSRVQRAREKMKYKMGDTCKLEFDENGRLTKPKDDNVKCKYCDE